MKYLNIALVALFTISMTSCGGEKSKTTPIVDAELIEMDDTDEIIEEGTDETEYLEAAITALENGDKELAITEINNAINSIKSYIDEMDDPSIANTAIKELTKIVTTIKSGTAMTADELQKTIMSLELFSDDELEIDIEEIDDEIEDEMES